jgi:hypothetical protein
LEVAFGHGKYTVFLRTPASSIGDAKNVSPNIKVLLLSQACGSRGKSHQIGRLMGRPIALSFFISAATYALFDARHLMTIVMAAYMQDQTGHR